MTKLAKNNSEDITVITFDLMKTLPTPLLSMDICYYRYIINDNYGRIASKSTTRVTVTFTCFS